MSLYHTPTTGLWQQIDAASPKNGSGWSLDHVERWSDEHDRRNHFLNNFSFAVPGRTAIARIKDFVGHRKLLEAGAGSGLWARLLSDAGVTVMAVDNKSFRGSITIPVSRYFPVERGDAVRAVRQHRDHEALMLCWPDYSAPMASKALVAFQGDRLIYIGEPESGCTGDDRFHQMLRCNWREVLTVPIPQWPGIHDEVYLYERAT